MVASSPVRSGTAAPPPALPFRVGHGFDLHRLEEGYPLIIGGIPVKVKPASAACTSISHCSWDVVQCSFIMPSAPTCASTSWHQMNLAGSFAASQLSQHAELTGATW